MVTVVLVVEVIVEETATTSERMSEKEIALQMPDV